MTTLYWCLEYAKVLLCYVFIMFIWPSVIFRKFLKGKSVVFRFSFCAATQVVIINSAVLMLGLAHILNPWTVNILFYGTLLLSLRKLFILNPSQIRNIRRLTAGSLKFRQVFLSWLNRAADWFKKSVWNRLRPNLIEYTLLAAILIYGVSYFSYSPLVDHSYGFGDMYTHHSWIYGLIQGQIFSAGVYPEAMHCVVYLMHTVTGFHVYSCNLFLGCIHVFVYLISAYCLMREIFRCRGTPLIVLTFFLVNAANSSDLMISMARLQRSLPGEYGLYTVFLCALFLLKFLKEEIPKGWQRHPLAWLKNDNLIVFCMSLAASIAIHFYVTITAFFVCVPFAIIYFLRTIRIRRFLPLATAVILGVTIAVIPMAGALLSGIPFQGSIGWALAVIDGTEVTTHTEDQLQTEETAAEPETVETQNPEPAEDEQLAPEDATTPAEEESSNASVTQRLADIWKTIRKQWFVLLYERGFSGLLGSRRTGVRMMQLLEAITVFCLLFRIICMIIRPLRRLSGIFDNYLPVIGAAFIIIILYSAPGLGIPELIAYIRLPSTAYIFMLMVAAMPIDIVLGALSCVCVNWLMQTEAVILSAAVFTLTVLSGNYHGYFYNELTRYRSVVDVTSSIIESFPRYTYTVVSSTDELYSVIQYGRHEEILSFLKKSQLEPGYYLPTEYIFIYVEKHPIQHAQYHFSSGPRWLGTDIYADNIDLGMPASKYPEIFSTQISEEDAQKDVMGYPVAYSSYRNSSIRTIINSKAYKWCKDFSDLFDNEMKVYYEDENFICYYFHQNINSLYDLAIWS